MPATVLVLCRILPSCHAGVDVAITRTPFATPLILTTLSGHPEVRNIALLRWRDHDGLLVRPAHYDRQKRPKKTVICGAGHGAVAVLQPGLSVFDHALPIHPAAAGSQVRC